MTLLIDNYDSFSYNLYQLIGSVDPDIQVIRNDAVTADKIKDLNPDRIVISPGPGKPSDAGICEEVIDMYKGVYPIMGVCLGHQAICEVFGAVVSHAKKLMHGKSSVVDVDTASVLFKGMNHQIAVARYHSLAAKEETMPECLKVTARADDGEIMAVEHRDYPVFGVQFHPESILTPNGIVIMRNFMSI
jgi:anthranilate synthase component 2